MIAQLYALYKREVLKLFRSRFMWAMILAQPVMWIIFFGNSLAGLPKGFLAQYFGVDNYLAYMLPGMITISMMTAGTFASISIVIDRRLGYLKRVLTTPTPRSAVFLAKALGGMTRGLLMVPVILVLGALLGVHYKVDWGALVAWLAGLLALGLGFSSLFAVFTSNTSDMHAPGVIANFVTMPLMFTSTAIFPREFFPTWLKALSEVNPLTYATELGREALIYGSAPSATALVALALFATATTVIGVLVVEARLSPD